MTMALDDELIKSVEEAVNELNQPPAVAIRVIKWLEGMSAGELSRADIDEHFKLTLNSIKTGVSAEVS